MTPNLSYFKTKSKLAVNFLFQNNLNKKIVITIKFTTKFEFGTLLKRLLVLEDSNPFETKGMPLKPKPVFKNGDLNPRKSLMRCYSCQPRLKTL